MSNYNIAYAAPIVGRPGVFKLLFGEKYFIYKGLSVKATVDNLSKQISRELSAPKEDSILFKVVCYIKTTGTPSATVEIKCISDDPLLILTTEYEELNKAKDDVNCLNIKFENLSYVPKWIPQKAVVKFKKLVETGSAKKVVHKDVHLRNYLKKMKLPDEDVNKIVEYVQTRYR